MDQSSQPDSNASAKDRLIQAGIDVFGDHSYEAATTRMIAQKAKVNIASIPYYFAGKEGLYQAVVEHIIAQVESVLGPTIKTMEEQAAQENLAPSEAISLIEALLGKMVDFMVGNPDATRFAQIVIREHLFPTAAYEIIFSQLFFPIIKGIATMIAKATGQPLSDAMWLRALSFMGQIMVFRVARETMVRALGFTAYSPQETQLIRRLILEQTRGIVESIARD